MTRAPQLPHPVRALILSGGGARGAFQVGVLKFLQERGWRPDLVCGSSIGAIHAAALAAGVDARQMEALWETRQLHRFHFPRRIGSAPPALLDSTPIRELLTRLIDFDALRSGSMGVKLCAVDVASSKAVMFDRSEITVDHVLASASVPSFYPWKEIAGKAFWDGGVMANTPILPAIEEGAEEIVAVFLSPVAAGIQKPSRSLVRITETVFEQMLAAPYKAAIEGYRIGSGRPLPRIHPVAPSRMLGLFSMMNFSLRQVRRLIRDGYRQAQTQLAGLFGK